MFTARPLAIIAPSKQLRFAPPGNADERDRPVAALRQIFSDRVERRAEHRETPRRGIVIRLDRRVRRKDHPALGVSRSVCTGASIGLVR